MCVLYCVFQVSCCPASLLYHVGSLSLLYLVSTLSKRWLSVSPVTSNALSFAFGNSHFVSPSIPLWCWLSLANVWNKLWSPFSELNFGLNSVTRTCLLAWLGLPVPDLSDLNNLRGSLLSPSALTSPVYNSYTYLYKTLLQLGLGIYAISETFSNTIGLNKTEKLIQKL